MHKFLANINLIYVSFLYGCDFQAVFSRRLVHGRLNEIAIFYAKTPDFDSGFSRIREELNTDILCKNTVKQLK